MIITEHYMTRFDGIELKITFSDQGRQVICDGVNYDEAVEPATNDNEYTEASVLADYPQAAVNYWVRLIQSGEYELNDVPRNLHDKVKQALAELPLLDGEISDADALNIILGKE